MKGFVSSFCLILLVFLVVAMLVAGARSAPAAGKDRGGCVVFAVFAANEVELEHAIVLAESIREFGGDLADAPVWIYTPPELCAVEAGLDRRARAAGVELRWCEAPGEALTFPYAGKVFAAARAERTARGRGNVLVWMDEDTVVIGEPRDVVLVDGKCLGYRPVMHRNIGSPVDEPVDPFWARVYRVLGVDESRVFPVTAVADRSVLRAYVNAGLLAVRPERGVLDRWAESFTALCHDSALVRICRSDRLRRTFLHQAALAGAILDRCAPEELVELPDAYNVPVFFKSAYGGVRDFEDLDGVVTLRYDVYFRDPDPDWSAKLSGDRDVIAWLSAHLGNR